MKDRETATRERYARAASAPEAALCCPVEYAPEYLDPLPREVIDKDYGCGDPTPYVRPGETVVDLGAGAGKICFIAAQIVGPEGKVIGVDMTGDMLEVARRNAPEVARAIGHDVVEFRQARIQDLKEAGIADGSVDVVVSNCVLNLVDHAEKPRLFAEIHRVLRPGGRAVISDIVADQPVPERLQADPELWSGCVSGALTRKEFLKAFIEAGFASVDSIQFDREAWREVEGVRFHSTTVEARKEGVAEAIGETCCSA